MLPPGQNGTHNAGVVGTSPTPAIDEPITLTVVGSNRSRGTYASRPSRQSAIRLIVHVPTLPPSCRPSGRPTDPT